MRTLILDTEVYPNWFYAAFLDADTGKSASVELSEGGKLNVSGLLKLLRTNRLVTFNGTSFDLPVLRVALAGEPTDRIHAAAEDIITRNLPPWRFDKAWIVAKALTVNHIDLIEVAPGVASLKLYGGRMHSRRLQDLPIAPGTMVTDEQKQLLRTYCRNDLDTTLDLYRKLLPQVELRASMSEQYGMDLRSKSDAQIAEAVLVHEAGGEVLRPVVEPGTAYRYKVPAFVSFQTPELKALLDRIAEADFVVGDNGAVLEPQALQTEVRIGAGVYRMGIGGLHSSETCQVVTADADHVLVDRDVASYYPAIILRLGLAPAQMGQDFLRAYRSIVDRRLAAKRSGDKVTADTLKIVVNGSFGKLGSKYSKLYSPDLLVQVTVTGQLCLLMLIESLEAAGIRVASANTDGIVIRCPKGLTRTMDAIVGGWESVTGFDTEATNYLAVYSRDVNSYIAVKDDGSVKLKGAYAGASLAKNPANAIAITAAVNWLVEGTSIRQTIRSCKDIRQFVTVRSVKGGAVKDGVYLGKVVRWYYAIGMQGVIQYQSNGYTVARSDGAKPLMDLPDEFPVDVDFDWYEREAMSVLRDVGAAGQIA